MVSYIKILKQENWMEFSIFFLYCARIWPIYSLLGPPALSSNVILVKLLARVASLDWNIGFIKGYEIKFPTKRKEKKTHFLPIVTSLFPLMRFGLTWILA